MEGSDEKGGLQRIIPSFSNDGQLGINGKMQNLSVDVNNNNNGSNFGNMNNSNNGNFSGGNSVRRSVGIPPSYPQARMGGGGAQNFTMGASAMHSRSVSQPSFSNFDHLPPLSPSTATFRDLPSSSNDNVNVVGLGLPGGGVSGVGSVGGGGGVNEGLPPRRGGHRRSSSDVPLGFAGNSMSQQTLAQFTSGPAAKPAQLVMKRDAEWGGSGSGDGEGGGEKKGEGELADDLILQYMNFDNMDGLNSSSMEDKDSRASCTRTNDSSENEVESSGGYGASSSYTGERGKRSAPEDVAHSGRHVRSLSMDSLMGNLNFNDESPKLPPSPGFRSAQHSPSNSFDGNANKFNLEFGNGEFNAAEMKKIMANEKLAEMARADPKRVKRILSNRVSAARSKERKMRYISELEHKVQTLQTEATTLSTQLTLLQRDSVGLTSQNNELKFRLQSMQQQAQLRDALNEALTAEVQRLKLATGERRGEPSPNFLPQQLMANHIFQMQPSQYMYQLQQQQHNQQQLQQNNQQQLQQNNQQQLQQNNQQQLQQNNQNQQQLQQNNQQPQQNWSAQSDQEAEARKS